MNALRSAALLASSVLITAWFVTLGVRATLGAPDVAPQVSIGAVPAPPRALAPLRIPGRDPFAADQLATPPAAATAARAAAAQPVGAPPSQLAATSVPDVAALGGSAPTIGIMATIVGGGAAYALVEDGGSVRVARVGESLGGSTIAAITDQTVVLANGVRIALDDQRPEKSATAPAAAAPAAVAPSPAPTDAPTVLPGAVRSTEDGAAGGHMLAAPRLGAPASTAQPATGISGFGHTVVTNPNGTPLQPLPPQGTSGGTLFPAVPPSPAMAPFGTTSPQPGGHP